MNMNISTEKLNDSTGELCNRDDAEQYLNKRTRSLLQKLDELWEEIGIDTSVRKEREDIVVKCVEDLYKDLLSEAQDEKNKLFETITTLLKELTTLEKDLNLKSSTDGLESLPYFTVKEKLKEKIQKYQNILATKQAEISKIVTIEKGLCQSLGKKPKLLPVSPIPSDETINDFKRYLEDLSNEKFIREENFTKTKLLIVDIMEELDIQPSLDFERNVVYGEDSAFMVTDENMTQLENFYSSLTRQKQNIHAEVQELRERVSTLWDRLEESPQYRSDFTEKYPGIKISTYRALKDEILRCEVKIKANIKIFIDKMRQEILVWWEKCLCSEQQKKEFIYFESDCYTEDLLHLHEREIDKLRNHYEKYRSMYDLIKKREELWNKLLKLDSKANEPDRFKNRGGQLLKEEKERNCIKLKIPKIEQELLELAEVYENENGISFKIKDQDLSEIINNDYEQLKENRHLKLSAKKQARDQNKTPAKSPRSILGYTNSNLKLTPHHPTSPKRKLTTQLFGSAKKPRTAIKSLPKIQVNGSTIRRVSLEREKRLERRRRSRMNKERNKEVLNSTDYNVFETDLGAKTSCRSTLFLEENKENNEKMGISSKSHTLHRVPSRMNLRAKSPITAARLTPARGNLPIII